MITIDQAKSLRYGDVIHGGVCSVRRGPRGSKAYKILRFRVSGMLRTWKRSPEKFELPLKYGLYGYGRMTERNAWNFHLDVDCPVLREE